MWTILSCHLCPFDISPLSLSTSFASRTKDPDSSCTSPVSIMESSIYPRILDYYLCVCGDWYLEARIWVLGVFIASRPFHWLELWNMLKNKLWVHIDSFISNLTLQNFVFSVLLALSYSTHYFWKNTNVTVNNKGFFPVLFVFRLFH